jgi:hypothetical protein
MAEDKNTTPKSKEYLQELRDRAAAQKQFTAEQANSSNIVEKITSNLEKHANLIDKSGTLSALMAGNLGTAQKASLGMQASFATIVKSTLQASNLTTNIAKSTGISKDNAKALQQEFIKVAANSGKVFITSQKLNKSFSTLTAQTGLVADFGGDTLEVFTELNEILGFSEEQAGKLSLLARLQSEDSRGVLENTIETVGALIKQKGIAISGRAVLEDISNVSSDIAVSLGMSPPLIAEAAVEARAFGATLEQINAIAGNLLDFETSINAELQAELFTGKQLNFEKARLFALTNDLAGVSRELIENEELRSEFLTGNRLEQEAIAQAIGLSRDGMADLVMQSQFAALSAEQFKDEFGEVAFNQFAALSASEKFQQVLVKVQGIIGDMGIIFMPVIDGIASALQYLVEMKGALPFIVGAFTTMATLSTIISVASTFAALAALGPPGVILGGLAVAGVLSTIAGVGTAIATATAIEDGVIDPSGGLVVSGKKGSIQLNKDDSIVAGTNLGGGGIDYDKMALAMSRAQINVSTRYDSFGARKSSAFNGSYQRDTRKNSSFA